MLCSHVEVFHSIKVVLSLSPHCRACETMICFSANASLVRSKKSAKSPSLTETSHFDRHAILPLGGGGVALGQSGFHICHHIIGDLQTTSLKKREDIVIMKADKGNATVVMDKEQYDEKLKDILQPPTYKRINRDPTSKTVKRVTH